ncbi:MAG: hypothetical protein U9N46_02995 [Euryarchaeota archaeon]|nr:MAG: hypothetical protein C5S47_04315 [ANME-2 cluster archaeon]MEA1864156.1 hypothetical protein [Euryarchaeota archaeon]
MNKTASRTALTALLTRLLGAIIVTATISSCYASTFSGDVITFTDLPSAIKIDPGSQASFDVTLRNSGSIYGDVDILTRSLPDGIMVVDNDCTKLVDMGKSVTYHITIAASNDMEPGTCHFEIADRSDVDRHTWETIEVRVGGRSVVATTGATPEGGGARWSPGFGVIAVVFALLLARHLRSRL